MRLSVGKSWKRVEWIHKIWGQWDTWIWKIMLLILVKSCIGYHIFIVYPHEKLAVYSDVMYSISPIIWRNPEMLSKDGILFSMHQDYSHINEWNL